MKTNNENVIVNVTPEETKKVNVTLEKNEIINVQLEEQQKIDRKIEEKIRAAMANPEIRKEMILALKLDDDVVISGLNFATTKYKALKTLPGNRQLNESNLRKLDLSITTHGYRCSQPITLNEQGQILNGQHRRHICQEKGLPVFFNYERTHSNSLELTVDMNISQRNWNLQDYVQSYSDRGFEDYRNILKLIEEQEISLSLALWLIYRTRNGNIQEAVREGHLRCNARDMQMVEKTVTMIKEIRDVIPDNLSDEKALRSAFLTEKVAVPLSTLMEEANYSQARMVKQVKNLYKSINRRNMRDCGETLVAIYNLRLKDAASRLKLYTEIDTAV